MKISLKHITAIILAISVSTPYCVSSTYAADTLPANYGPTTRLVVNDQELTNLPVPPVIYNDYTLVPAREVFEALGAVVNWKPETNQVYISYEDTQVIMEIDNKFATVNGQAVEMSVPPKIIDGKTMVPLRFISDAFGFQVDWNPHTHTAYVSNKKTVANTNGVGVLPPVQAITTPAAITPAPVAITPAPVVVTPAPVAVTQPLKPAVTVELAKDVSKTTIDEKFYTETQITNVVIPKPGTPATFIIEASSPISKVTKTLFPDNRLVIDIEAAENKVPNSEFVVTSPYVKRVKVSEYQEVPTKITRVTFDLVGAAEYSVSISNDRTSINVDFSTAVNQTTSPAKATTLKNISYNKNANQIVLKKDPAHPIKLSDITITDNYSKLNYIINLSGNYKDYFGLGEYIAYDEYIQSFTVKNNAQNQTEIIINENQISAYNITEDAQNIYITAISPKEKYNKIVVIDAGHGGEDGGTSSDEIDEKDIVFNIANMVVEKCNQGGQVKAYASRTTDVKVPLEDRAEFGNQVGDLFISIHVNSHASNLSANGIENHYYPHENDMIMGLTSEEMAMIMQDTLIKNLGAFDRGIKESNFVVLRNTEIPAILIETGFLSNSADKNNLVNPVYQEKLADAIYKGILEIFKVYTPQR